MWWECSECGDQVERARAPAVCDECGTAGVIYVPVDVDDPIVGKPGSGGLRTVWLSAGMKQAGSPWAE
jgi:hypothetical protein